MATGKSQQHLVLFALLVCLFVFLRLWHLAYYGLDLDEIFSFQIAQLGWKRVFTETRADIVHPPLFYLLLKIWLNIGGRSLLGVKLFPVLISFGTLVPLVLLCRELKLTAAEMNTALFLVAVNAFLIQYAQELRMYSLLIFFSLWSCWLFVRLAGQNDSPKRIFAGLFIVNLLLVYTHYFGWLLIGAEVFYLLFRQRRQLLPFAITVAAIALCFIPWVYIVFQSIAARGGLKHNLGWISQPHKSELIWYFALLDGLIDIHPYRIFTALGLILFGFPLLLWAWDTFKDRRKSSTTTFSLLVSVSLLPVIFAFLANYLLPQPVWSDRFLISHAIPYLILISVAVYRLRAGWTRTLTILLIIGWAGFSCIHRLSRDNARFNWSALVNHMTEAETAGIGPIPVYAFETCVAVPMDSALTFSKEGRFEVRQLDHASDVRGEHFWVAIRDFNPTSDRLPQALLRNKGCWIGQEFSVSTNRGENFVGTPVTLFPGSCEPGR